MYLKENNKWAYSLWRMFSEYETRNKTAVVNRESQSGGLFLSKLFVSAVAK